MAAAARAAQPATHTGIEGVILDAHTKAAVKVPSATLVVEIALEEALSACGSSKISMSRNAMHRAQRTRKKQAEAEAKQASKPPQLPRGGGD